MTGESFAETIVVGAGPAGLAAAASLRHEGLAFEVLERAATIASTWRAHYDRLHLHTVRDQSALPYWPWPRGTPRFPSRDQVVAYAQAYARHFEVTPHFETTVTRARRSNDAWVIETSTGPWRSNNLIVATGHNHVPVRPAIGGDFRGTIVHSSEYRSGAEWRGKRALVVGSGNSGAEIAVDLAEHGAAVGWVVRGPAWVAPVVKWGISNQENSIALSMLPLAIADAIARGVLRVTVGDLSRYGIVAPAEGPLSMIWNHGRVPILDVGTIDLVKKGAIHVHPGVTQLTATGAVFTDGDEHPFDLVVLATGYRPGIGEFLEGADEVCDASGRPRRHGIEAGIPGLYFIGFRNPPTGALREIAMEGPRIARAIAP